MTSDATPFGAEAAKYILVADDEPLLLLLLERVLRAGGLRVLTAPSAAAALEACARHGPAVGAALVDVRLGREDGTRLVAGLRACVPGLPVALMSGDANLTPAALHALGVALVLAKPFRRLADLAVVAHALLASAAPPSPSSERPSCEC
jgi:CheY-like chemotaxis protein